MNRDGVLFCMMAVSFFWQSVPTFIALILFCLFKTLKISLPILIILSLFIIIVSLSYTFYADKTLHIKLLDSFKDNILFWKLLFRKGVALATYFEVQNSCNYLLVMPIPLATCLYRIHMSSKSAHSETMKEISLNQFPSINEVSPTRISKVLKHLEPEKFDGILLGASLKTGKPIVIPDYYVNQIALVLGTTGSGKTVTLQRFFHRAILKGYPLIIVDGKPTNSNVDYVQHLAEKYKRNFFGFNCGSFNYYNPLSHGGYTELKDKIITLKDYWDNEYYRAVASDYLQTAIEILIKTNQSVDLRTIASYLDFANLTMLLRKYNAPELISRVKPLAQYDRKALTGLQAHLNILANSELGKYFENNLSAFSLSDVISQNAVAYFALPALRYADFSKILGKLIINDIKSVIEPLENKTPIFIVFDEFSVFAGDQVLNLINMGRGKGLHTVLGTQGLADLKRVDPQFESQLLNCINTIICHRLNHQTCAETISKWIGTQDSYDITAQISLMGSSSSLGSASKNKSFIVHPDEIKHSLTIGQAFCVNKVERFIVNKVQILKSYY